GGSAPKHVDQFITENHLRWDSLGEFLALAVSLEHFSEVNNNPKAQVLADALDDATERLLENKKGPSRNVVELDNRGSHFYLAKYWAEALSKQNSDANLKAEFTPIAEALNHNESVIIEELNSIQGAPVNIEGYYFPNEKLVSEAMKPSKTFNAILS